MKLSTSMLLIVGGLAMAAAACGSDSAGPENQPTVRDRLQTTRYVGMAGEDVVVTMAVNLRDGDVLRVFQRELAVTYGVMSLNESVDGDLILASVDLGFEDLVVGDKGRPPTGLHLTDLRMRSEKPHACDLLNWADDDDACYASVPVDVLLEATMVMSDGFTVKLPAQPVYDLRFDMTVGRDKTGLWLDVSSFRRGPLWSYDGSVELVDFGLEGFGHELIPMD